MVARRFVISGRVQGVGFRHFTVKAARGLGVAGWVRNLPDGRVEAVAEGDPGALASFRGMIAQGPPGAVVSGLETAEIEPNGAFEGFKVRF